MDSEVVRPPPRVQVITTDMPSFHWTRLLLSTTSMCERLAFLCCTISSTKATLPAFGSMNRRLCIEPNTSCQTSTTRTRQSVPFTAPR